MTHGRIPGPGMALQVLGWVLTVQPSHQLEEAVYQRSTSGVLTPSSAPYLPGCHNPGGGDQPPTVASI
jgi:hypothetical protein